MNTNRRIVTSVGYSFAFAALCSLALGPGVALADEVAESAASDDAREPVVSDRASNAPVAKEKSETVYIFANADGSVKNTEVSTTLKNPDGHDELADSSVLTDIENVENDNTFTGSGKDMVWATGGENVYYTGATSKDAPVSVKVTYFLDGKKTAPEHLAGATGHLKIRYDYENSATVKAQINGKEEELYVPFTFITALLFDNDDFRNVSVENGKVIDDGDRVIVAGFAMPGLQKSLGSIADDFDIPDYFEVEADVADFEMQSTLTIATAGLLEDFDTDDIDTGELSEASADLKDAMGQILDGANALTKGLDKLAEGTESVKVATGQLKDGIGAKDDTAEDGTLLGGINSLKDGYDEQLLSPVKGLQKKVNQAIAENATNITAAWEAVQGMDLALAALGEATDALGEVDKADLQEVGTELADLQEKLNAAKGAIAKANATIGTLENLDFDAVEASLTSVGGNMGAAGGDIQATADAIKGADIQGNLTKIGVAATGIKGMLQDGKIVPNSSDETKQKEIGAEFTGYLLTIHDAIAEVQGSDLGSVEGYLTDAGTELTAGGQTLTGVGDMLTGLKGQIPSDEEVAEIEALLKEADESLSTENLAIINQSIDSLETSLAKLDIDELNGEIAALKQYYPAIATYIEGTSAQDAMEQLQSKLDETVEGMESVSAGLASEQKGLNKLRKGVDQLNDGAAQLAEGADAAAEGSGKLADGLQEFNDEGIGQITDLIDDDLLPFVDRLDAITAAAADYDNFAGITDGTDGEVKFVFETDPISVDDD